jgi:hypothetical protein
VIAAPSLARDVRLVWSGDTALDAPVRRDSAARLPDESEDDHKEREEAWGKVLRAWWDRLRIARETGDWEPLLKPGEQPTWFVMRWIPGDLWRQVPRVTGEMALPEQLALVVRLGLVGIENAPPGFKVELAQHVDVNGLKTGLGKVAVPELISKLDLVDTGIVTELGAVIADRQNGGPPGK